MKTALLVAAALLISGGLYFLFQSPHIVHVTLIGHQAGVLHARDKEMQIMLVERLRYHEKDTGIHFVFSYLDASLKEQALADRLDEIEAVQPVDMVLGCGDSFCVRRVLPELEKRQMTLIYPGTSEGLFSSESLVHLGPLPNQYLFPVLSWIKQYLGRRIYYLGGEDIRSRMQGRMLQQHLLPISGATLVEERYLGELEQLPSILDSIHAYKPDVLLLDNCDWMYHPSFVEQIALVQSRIFSLCSDMAIPMALPYYFISHYLNHPHNQKNLAFVDFSQRHNVAANGLNAMAFTVADLIAQLAAERAINTDELNYRLKRRNALTAAGSIAIDDSLQGNWHTLFIGERAPSGTRLLWMSEGLVRPEMFPGAESPSDWQHNTTIYWRNNRGQWSTRSVGGEPWL